MMDYATLTLRLRDLYQKSAHNKSLSNEEWEAIVSATAAIEALVKERDEWKATADHLLGIEQEWIDENNRLADEYKKLATLLENAECALEMLCASLDLDITTGDISEWNFPLTLSNAREMLGIIKRARQ